MRIENSTWGGVVRTEGPSMQDLLQSCHRASAGSSELLEPWELNRVRRENLGLIHQNKSWM